MGLLKTNDRVKVRDLLDAEIRRPVTLALFTARQNCPYCDTVREMLDELAELNDNLSVRVLDGAQAAALGLDKTPGLAILGGTEQTDYGIRFYGIPAGYEFTSLLEAIRMVGGDSAELQPATQTFLNELTQPLHLQVFVTPSCPYCPGAVVLAHRLAYASPLITAAMVEVSEFPELGNRYDVMGVPRTVISDVTAIEGAVPEAKLRERLATAVQIIAQPA